MNWGLGAVGVLTAISSAGFYRAVGDRRLSEDPEVRLQGQMRFVMATAGACVSLVILVLAAVQP